FVSPAAWNRWFTHPYDTVGETDLSPANRDELRHICVAASARHAHDIPGADFPLRTSNDEIGLWDQ
ncbi:MAG: hypothetical protein CSA84_07625, partial [Actinomycetales bacterium]